MGYLISGAALILSVVAFIRAQTQWTAARKPHLVFLEQQITEDGRKCVGFFVRNIGITPALNLEIPQRYIEQYDFLSEWDKIPRDLAPTGETMCAYYDGRKITKDFCIEVVYQNVDGKKYATKLSGMRHTFSTHD